MWNLALPLLQSNLRHHVRKPLTLAAQALEDIDRYIKLILNIVWRHPQCAIAGYKNIPIIDQNYIELSSEKFLMMWEVQL